MPVIDGDGHVFEDVAAILEYFPAAERRNLAPIMRDLFPQLDHLHHALATIPAGTFRDPGPAGWVTALDTIGLAASALYPTNGLAIGRVIDADLAVTTCVAYNNWLESTYVRHDGRLKGVALLPLQDPDAAAAELHRAVTELGFVGGVLPSTGLKSHLGDSLYWPVYRMANRLGCSLAVHGGGHSGLGLDRLEVFAAVHALGHPFGIATALAGMTFNGVFARFPDARFAFLEGGVGWFVMAMERFDASYAAFTPMNPRGRLLHLRAGESVADHLLERMASRQVVIGIEGEEPVLGWAVRQYGGNGFMYTSDHPHEVTLDGCRHSIAAVAGNAALDDVDRRAILIDNAAACYGLRRTGGPLTSRPPA